MQLFTKQKILYKTNYIYSPYDEEGNIICDLQLG